VRQLLAFSRRQTLQPKRIDLTDLLAELSDLIRRLIGENIDLNITHQRDIWAVKVDQGQLEQVIINLAVNARDAMKDMRGKLRIETRNMTVDSLESLDSELRIPPQEETITPGDYVAITISDNGTGIPDHVIDKIFEPFFSTKEVGSGTGLGLATVYGIIKQTGGYIYLKTQEGKGTSFTVFIPRMMGDEVRETSPHKEHASSQDLTGAATILLVEDETPVRLFASRALQNKGYEVLEADCGESGLEMYAAHKDRIEVIISDVVMPGINGPTMVETLDLNHADSMKNVEVIFISGYAEDAFVDGYKGNRTFNFLSKPFTLKQLAAKIKDITEG
jgi:two-component system, cell cycle sensor histidine kinase and response regulator CckA